MLRKKWLIFASLFLAGAAAGAAVALPFCPSSLTGQARIWATLGQGFIVLFAIAIPVGYLILMTVGAIQVSRPPDVISDQQHTWVHTAHRVRRVLVTAGGGANARLGMELAARIATDDDGQVTLMRVLAPEQAGNQEDMRDELTRIAAEALGPDFPITVVIPIRESIVSAVLEEAGQGYDLLVVGASEQRPLRNWLFGALPDMIARQAPCPVLVVRGGKGQ
jgi:nucleotide-binding universal stress UspA family protein